jgi:hypothetical protein
MKTRNLLVRRMPLATVLSIMCVGLLMLASVPAAENTPGLTRASEGIITGFVTDSETGNPIVDCEMILKYHDEVHIEYTDSKGLYTFTSVPICFCLKELTAKKEGYESQTKMVAVHKITYVDFALNPTNGGGEPTEGIIIGFVTDSETGDPIADAKMTLKYHEEVHIEFTDPQGYYKFTDVPICFCLKNVSASKKGYESEYEMVAVSEITYVNFSLNPASDENPYDSLEQGKSQVGFVQSESLLNSFVGLISLLALGLVIVAVIIHRKKGQIHEHD